MRETRETAGSRSASGRVVATGEVVTIEDVLADADYGVPAHALAQTRSILAAPLLREDAVGGVVVIARRRPGGFSERQIELVRTFADQAVIAIENARLFDEVRNKTRDLEKSLAQQTATADVLKVISRSAFDLQTVLDTLAKSAAGLGGADFAVIYFSRGDVVRAEATFGCSPEFIEFMARTAQRPGKGTTAGRVFLTGEVVTIPDVEADPDYRFGDGPRIGNYRAVLGVPLFRDHKVEGAFILGRQRPAPFTRREIELTQTFADQAVIAIENVRLFDELQARTPTSKRRWPNRPRPPTC